MEVCGLIALLVLVFIFFWALFVVLAHWDGYNYLNTEEAECRKKYKNKKPEDYAR